MIRLKNPRQIAAIKESCRLLAQVMDTLEGAVQPGISTAEIDALAKKEISAFGARPSFLGYKGFPGSICTSVNEQVIHGIPNKRRLQSGDLLGIDCGIEYNGFYSDSAITVPVGRVSNEYLRLLNATKEALEVGIRAAVVGARVNDISRAVYEVIRRHGYGVVRPYCGHGVGFSIHEDPQVPNYVGRGPNPRLKAGMVLAIEPMVNLGGDDVDVLDDDWTVVTSDGSASAHCEHTVAILSDRTEVLTRRVSEKSFSEMGASKR